MSNAGEIVRTDEISRILKEAKAASAEVSTNLLVGDFEIVEVEDTKLTISRKFVNGVAPPINSGSASSEIKPEIRAGMAIEVIFSQVDGQYAIRDEVRDLMPYTFRVDAGQSLIRMQRRQDFRVSVKHASMTFVSNKPSGTLAAAYGFALLDLSVGGLRMLWPPEAGDAPRKNEKLSGRLILRAGSDESAIGATLVFVKDHGPEAPLKPELGRALSFKFEQLSQDETRQLLFACVGIARSIYGSR